MRLKQKKPVSHRTHLATVLLVLLSTQNAFAGSTDDAEAGFAKAQNDFARQSKNLRGEKYETLKKQILDPAQEQLDQAYAEKERQRSEAVKAEATKAASQTKIKSNSTAPNDNSSRRESTLKQANLKQPVPAQIPEERAVEALDGSNVKGEMSFSPGKSGSTSQIPSAAAKGEGASEIEFK